MAKKYLKTIEVVKQTGCSYDEILDLVRTNVLSGYKTKRGHWRLSVESVEKHYGILINEPSTVKAPKSSKQDKDDKLICGHTARKYLGCSKAEFESLVEQGFIQACRDDYGRWRVSKQSILNYTARSHTSSDTRLISNESHYQEVIERICAFIKYLMAKAVQGVSVQIICSEPSSTFSEEWKEYYRQMMNPNLFEYKYCDRNHAKVVIIDDKLAYVGSANVTPAGLGQGIFTPGNFEAGMITENQDLVSSVNTLFSSIWDNNRCKGCHRAAKCNEDSR